MARRRVLDEIRGLNPEHDQQRIVFLSTCYEFPFDTTRALEFALFRTFAVPTISALLDRTGEFASRAQKRYDDTDIIVSELMEWGYDSDRGNRALDRMNQIHGRFDINNDDFLYELLRSFVMGIASFAPGNGKLPPPPQPNPPRVIREPSKDNTAEGKWDGSELLVFHTDVRGGSLEQHTISLLAHTDVRG